MDSEMDFDTALNTFVAQLQERIVEHYAKRFPNLKPTQISIDKGRKFHRIVKTYESAGRSVHCFVAVVDSTTKMLGTIKQGDILKSASWKQPAKHVRGTIFSDTFDDYGVGEYGANYLS